MSKAARTKVRRVAARPRNAPLTFPDRRFIVSIDELVNELTPRIRRALENSLDKPDQVGAVEAVRSMVDKLTPPILADTADKQPIDVTAERASESQAAPMRAAPDDPPTVAAATYIPLAERDPKLAHTMQAAIERIATRQPIKTPSTPEETQPISATQHPPGTEGSSGGPEPGVTASSAGGIPLDVQFGQAGKLAVEFVLWLSRGILLGIGTVGGAALTAWALIESAGYSVKPFY